MHSHANSPPTANPSFDSVHASSLCISHDLTLPLVEDPTEDPSISPEPPGKLAYEPTHQLIYYSDGLVWKLIGRSDDTDDRIAMVESKISVIQSKVSRGTFSLARSVESGLSGPDSLVCKYEKSGNTINIQIPRFASASTAGVDSHVSFSGLPTSLIPILGHEVPIVAYLEDPARVATSATVSISIAGVVTFRVFENSAGVTIGPRMDLPTGAIHVSYTDM